MLRVGVKIKQIENKHLYNWLIFPVWIIWGALPRKPPRGYGPRSQSRSLWPMRSIKVCKEVTFRFTISFKTQQIRCRHSTTMLTLSEMRFWWIAWNSEMHWVFPSYWLFGFNQTWDDYPGSLGVEAWQALRCEYYHSFLSRCSVVTAGCFQHSKYIIQHAEHIHLWRFIKTFQLNLIEKSDC